MSYCAGTNISIQTKTCEIQGGGLRGLSSTLIFQPTTEMIQTNARCSSSTTPAVSKRMWSVWFNATFIPAQPMVIAPLGIGASALLWSQQSPSSPSSWRLILLRGWFPNLGHFSYSTRGGQRCVWQLLWLGVLKEEVVPIKVYNNSKEFLFSSMCTLQLNLLRERTHRRDCSCSSSDNSGTRALFSHVHLNCFSVALVCPEGAEQKHSLIECVLSSIGRNYTSPLSARAVYIWHDTWIKQDNNNGVLPCHDQCICLRGAFFVGGNSPFSFLCTNSS